MVRRKHIGVHYGAITGGGAPRIVRDQIRYLLDAGHKVTFLTRLGTDTSELAHQNFNVVVLEEPDCAQRTGFVQRSIELRRRIKALDLDILISHSVRHGTRYGVVALLLRMRQIIVDHAYPPTTLSLLTCAQRFSLRWVLRNTRFLCVSKGAANSFSENIGRPVGYAYNYAPDESIAASYRGMKRNKTVIALGRFNQEKQFDKLIDAFERISHLHPTWRLHLYGSGPDKEKLMRQARGSACPDHIKIFGWSDNPLQIMGEAGIVAQTSRYEGFGLTLIEAMAVGSPVVTFNCPYGPSEFIANRENGILVKDQAVEAFSEALDELICDADLRHRLGNAATDVTKVFSKEAHVSAWLREIEDLS